MNLNRRQTLALGTLLLPLVPGSARSAQPIKVGVLHSLTGTMSISETPLKKVMLMLIEDQNKKGGLLGRPIEAVVVDPASDWPMFAEKMRELVVQHRVAAIFGCWTSASRKAVLPVAKELNSLLFYPVQYEGEESERNVFYLGASPNQQAIPAVDFLQNHSGDYVVRWVLLGTDYVYPRTTNKILEAYLLTHGVAQKDIKVIYTPFGHSDWSSIVSEIKAFGSTGRNTAVISTVNGDANIHFYAELARQQIDAHDIPVMAFSVGEAELAHTEPAKLVRHLAAWNYFQSVNSPANAAFIKRWREFTKDPEAVTSDPMEAHYIGFNMWVKAVEIAGSEAPDDVIDTIVGVEVHNLSGGVSRMLANHHVTKPIMIGEIREDGQFDIVHSTGLVPGDAWSDYLPESKELEADWVDRNCGRFNRSTGVCQS